MLVDRTVSDRETCRPPVLSPRHQRLTERRGSWALLQRAAGNRACWSVIQRNSGPEAPIGLPGAEPVPERPHGGPRNVGRVRLDNFGRFGARNPIRIVGERPVDLAPVVRPLLTIGRLAITRGALLWLGGGLTVVALAVYAGYLIVEYADREPVLTPSANPEHPSIGEPADWADLPVLDLPTGAGPDEDSDGYPPPLFLTPEGSTSEPGPTERDAWRDERDEACRSIAGRLAEAARSRNRGAADDHSEERRDEAAEAITDMINQHLRTRTLDGPREVPETDADLWHDVAFLRDLLTIPYWDTNIQELLRFHLSHLPAAEAIEEIRQQEAEQDEHRKLLRDNGYLD